MDYDDLIEGLKHAMTTAQNDDMSVPRTEGRMRHLARQAAFQAAIDAIESLRAQLASPLPAEVEAMAIKLAADIRYWWGSPNFDLDARIKGAFSSLARQVAAPLPAEVEALIRRVQGREDCYDEVVQMLGRLARQVAAPLPDEVETILYTAKSALIEDGSPSTAKELDSVIRSLARQVAELTALQERNEGRVKAIVNDELLARAERAEAERDELRKDAERYRQVLLWMNRKGGMGLDVHALIDRALAAQLDQEDRQRGGL